MNSTPRACFVFSGQVRLFFIAMVFAAGTSLLQGQAVLSWGANGSGPPLGGSGTWNNVLLNWTPNNGVTYQTWANGGNKKAIFGGAGGTVTIGSGTVSASSMTFNSDGYVLNSGTKLIRMVFNFEDNSPVIRVTNQGQTATINGRFSTQNSAPLFVEGGGTLVLTGTSGISFGLVATTATVKLLTATGTISSSVAQYLYLRSGGTFETDNVGATKATSQSFDDLLLYNHGDTTLRSTRTAAQNVSMSFAMQELSGYVDVGRTINYVINGGVNGTENKITCNAQAAGFVDKGAYFNGADFAWYDTGGFFRAINYGVDAGTLSVGPMTSVSSTSHLQITGAITGQTSGTFTTLKIAGANDFTVANGNTVTVNGILKSGGDGAILTGGTIRGGGTEMVVRTDLAGDTLTIGSVIANGSGPSVLTKSGAGTLVLTGNNTFTGDLYALGGTISVDALPAASEASPLGSGTFHFVQGALRYTGSADVTTAHLFTVEAGGGRIDVSQAGVTLNISSAISGKDTKMESDALAKIGPGSLVLSGAADNTGLNVAVNSGLLQLAKASSSTVHAASGLFVNGGTAQLAGTGGDQISNAGGVTMKDGAVLDFNGRNESFDLLDGAGSVTNNAAANSTMTLGANPDATANSHATFGGAISDGTGGGTLAVVKTGSGTQIFAGESTYSGGTTVAGGMLIAKSNSAMGAGAVLVSGEGVFLVDEGATVANDIVLAGGEYRRNLAGSLADAVNATSDLGGVDTTASILSGTTGATTLTTSFSATSIATNDELRRSDVYLLNGTDDEAFVLELSLVSAEEGAVLGWLNGGQWVTATAGNTGNNATGEMLNFQGGFDAFQAEFGGNLGSYMGAYGVEISGGVTSVWAVLDHNSAFAVVPEPGTAGLLALGVAGLLRRRYGRKG